MIHKSGSTMNLPINSCDPFLPEEGEVDLLSTLGEEGLKVTPQPCNDEFDPCICSFRNLCRDLAPGRPLED